MFAQEFCETSLPSNVAKASYFLADHLLLVSVKTAPTSTLILSAQPIIEAGVAVTGTSLGAALLNACLFNNPSGPLLFGKNNQLSSVKHDGIQAASEPTCDLLRMMMLNKSPNEQISPGMGTAAGLWQLQRCISQPVNKQVDGIALHFQKD